MCVASRATGTPLIAGVVAKAFTSCCCNGVVATRVVAGRVDVTPTGAVGSSCGAIGVVVVT